MPKLIQVFDQGAEHHPKQDQVICPAQTSNHGLTWVCQLPLLHGGPHASGPERWSR